MRRKVVRNMAFVDVAIYWKKFLELDESFVFQVRAGASRKNGGKLPRLHRLSEHSFSFWGVCM